MIVETKVASARAFNSPARISAAVFGARHAPAPGVLLARPLSENIMKVVFALASVMMLSAAAANGTGRLIDSMPPHTTELALHRLSEPTSLVVVGIGFVLLASRVRKKS
jgi:hypothetical protein